VRDEVLRGRTVGISKIPRSMLIYPKSRHVIIGFPLLGEGEGCSIDAS